MLHGPLKKTTVAHRLKTSGLEEYLKPAFNVTYERFLFNTCNQQSHESIDKYVNKLRGLSETCKFVTLGDSLIKDCIVLGTKNKQIQVLLLNQKDLILDKALSVCRKQYVMAGLVGVFGRGARAWARWRANVISARTLDPKPKNSKPYLLLSSVYKNDLFQTYLVSSLKNCFLVLSGFMQLQD